MPTHPLLRIAMALLPLALLVWVAATWGWRGVERLGLYFWICYGVGMLVHDYRRMGWRRATRLYFFLVYVAVGAALVAALVALLAT